MGNYQFTLHSHVLLMTTAIALAMAWRAWQRKGVPGARALAWLELATAEWAIAAAFESAAIGLSLKVLWSQIAYLGTTTVPVFYILFAITYVQPHRRLSNRAIALLFVIPILTFIIAMTNPWHGWLWPEITLSPDPTYNLAIYGHGPWFWIFMAYNYTLILAGTLRIYRAMVHAPAFYHSQLLALIIGSALPVLGNILYLSRLNPIPGLDWTPLTFALTGIILAWGMLKYQVLDLTPLARTYLVENMLDGVIVLDMHNRIVDINPAAQALLGNSPELQIGQAVDETGAAWFLSSLDHCSESLSTEIALSEKGGRTLEVQTSPLKDPRGDALGCLIVLRDITARKRAEEALQALNTTLEAQVASRTAEIRDEKEKVETILQSVDNATLLLDTELKIRYVNRAFTELTGYTIQETLGKAACSMGAGALSEEIQHAIKAALKEGTSWKGEVTGQRKDGRTYEAALVVIPVRDTAGRITGYVSSQRDISQRKALEEARRQFMINVSHELRTPVTSLKLYTHLLSSQDEPDKRERYLQMLEQETERLEELVRDILELTALDSGQAITAWEIVSLPSLLDSVTIRYRNQAQKAGLAAFITVVPATLPAVRGDPERLGQAIGELIDNAIIFTPEGGEITITAGTVKGEAHPWVTITVQDTGPGIPSEEHDRVFDRFYRGSIAESGHIPGTGLGLSIVQEILEAHGGRVTLQSHNEQGTAFTLWLPVA